MFGVLIKPIVMRLRREAVEIWKSVPPIPAALPNDFRLPSPQTTETVYSAQ